MLEHLEERIAPASVATFQDSDGDIVTIKSSKGDIGAMGVVIQNGGEIETINLDASFEGANLIITANGDGDGFVDIGYINAIGVNLGEVKIQGKLGEIDAGSNSTEIAALKKLDVYGLSIQTGGNPDRLSNINGDVQSLVVRGDVDKVGFRTDNGGDIGKVKITGSLIGDTINTGSIISTGSIGTVKIVGDLNGGASGHTSGSICSFGDIGKVYVGGSLIGGTPKEDGISDSIFRSGSIYAVGNIDMVKITGDVRGGSAMSNGIHDHANDNGSIISQQGRIAKVTIGGDLIAGMDETGGTFYNNGAIRAHWDIGSINIKGNVTGNDTANVFISGGGQENPDINGDMAIKSLKIGGTVKETLILGGYEWDSGGFNNDGIINADAQIGNVLVGGNFTNSSIIAGIRSGLAPDGQFGDNGDSVPAASTIIKNSSEFLSKIAKVVIKGMANSLFAEASGIEAQEIGVFKAGGQNYDFAKGAGNDLQGYQLLSLTVREFAVT